VAVVVVEVVVAVEELAVVEELNTMRLRPLSSLSKALTLY